MEMEGLISRETSGRKTRVGLTEKGLRVLEDLYERLERALYCGLILGEVVSGLGEGSYYVRLYRDRIREYLGFDPFPGTLNVRVLFPKTIFDALVDVRPILIPGFVRDGRTFGDVKAYPVKIEDVEGAIVVPSRSVHPPKIAEIIAPVNLREALNLKDGSKIRIKALGGR
jgi:riboflavin kinase